MKNKNSLIFREVYQYDMIFCITLSYIVSLIMIILNSELAIGKSFRTILKGIGVLDFLAFILSITLVMVIIILVFIISYVDKMPWVSIGDTFNIDRHIDNSGKFIGCVKYFTILSILLLFIMFCGFVLASIAAFEYWLVERLIAGFYDFMNWGEEFISWDNNKLQFYFVYLMVYSFIGGLFVIFGSVILVGFGVDYDITIIESKNENSEYFKDRGVINLDVNYIDYMSVKAYFLNIFNSIIIMFPLTIFALSVTKDRDSNLLLTMLLPMIFLGIRYMNYFLHDYLTRSVECHNGRIFEKRDEENKLT